MIKLLVELHIAETTNPKKELHPTIVQKYWERKSTELEICRGSTPSSSISATNLLRIQSTKTPASPPKLRCGLSCAEEI